MVTREELEESFKTDLRALLAKYNAEMDVDETCSGWGSIVNGIQIYIPSIYNDNHDCISEDATFTIGKWSNKDCV